MLQIKEKRHLLKWAIIVIVLFIVTGLSIFILTKIFLSDTNTRIAAEDEETPSLFTNSYDSDFQNDNKTSNEDIEDPSETSSTNQDKSSSTDTRSSNSSKNPDSNKITNSNTDSQPNQPTTIKVTGVTMNPNTLTLTRGNSANLTATVSPDNATDKSVSWSSSNSNIISVTIGGRIVALKKGSATITVKTTDGNYTATADIKVVNPELKISSWIYPSTIIANGITSQGVATGVNASGGSEDHILKIEVYRNGTLVRTGHNRVDVAGSGEYYAKWTVDDAEEGTRTGTTETVTVP